MMLTDTLAQALRVTAFVAVMMIAVEYLNVLTRGAWARALSASPSRQYLLAVLLGATPGCLGAFAVVALYSHRMVSFGALVAAMIATSGDEAFVMLALFPGTAVLLMAGLALVGWAAGTATDVLLVASSIVQDGHGMLPLLAYSRSDFVKVKAINLAVGLAVGAALMALGW